MNRATTHQSAAAPPAARAGWAARWIKLLQIVIPVGVVAGLVLAYFTIGSFHAGIAHAVNVLSSGDAHRIRAYIQSFGAWAPIVSLLLMVLQGVAAPIPGFLVVLANGLAFGVFWGWLLSMVGLFLAGTVCFWLARLLGRGTAEALTGKLGLASTDRWVGRYGAIGILIARLIPAISFDAISYAAGVTSISYWRFALATVLGTAPQTFLYAYLGQTAPQYTGLLLKITIGVLVALVLFLVYRRWRSRSRRLEADGIELAAAERQMASERSADGAPCSVGDR